MRIVLLAAVALLAAACGSSSSDTTASAKPAGSGAAPGAKTAAAAPTGPMFTGKAMGMDMSKPIVDIDLSPVLDGYTIKGPEGAKVEKAVPGGGARVVNAGVNYSIAIREGEFKADAPKGGWKALDPDGTFLTDTPELVVFQRKSGSVLFSMGVTVGDKKFTCGSVATAMDFEKSTIDQTIESCKTLKKK